MAIQYPGGTIVNSTFTGATRADIATNLETLLVSAGWSVVSGTGSTDILLQSASTPTAANYIRVRLRSTLITNCCAINMQNDTGSKVSQNYHLLPAAAKTFRVVANQYQFFCFTPGTSAAREYVACGVPYTPSFLHSVITGPLGWISGNGNSDTDAVVRPTFRTTLASFVNGSTGWFSGLVNNNQCDSTTSGNHNVGGMRLITQQGSILQQVYGYRWHDDSVQLVDPLLAWGLTSGTADEAKIRGQIWGAVIITDTFAGDTVLTSVDGHDWIAITNSNPGNSTDARGTLFIAIT